MNRKDLRLFFIIFTASGFAGLIYESIWTHYLKLFLGHAAYAQALVLAVFMGGMAIGSLLCSKYSEHLGNLLLAYAATEVIIGICSVFFHPLYVHFIDFTYTTIMPGLGSPLAVAIFKWTAASLLILPQSILLGMTFPLMTAGLIRKIPQAPGSIVAMLYFTNSIGAAIGVLAAGFLFVGWVGLSGTLVIAGFINITVAAVVLFEDKKSRTYQPGIPPAIGSALSSATPSVIYTIFLLIALLTGLSSFIYEIGWIRMLSLVLGSSTHAFELMLSAFITGIAFGGLWIKRRIDSLDDPRRFLALVQVAMGILALATLPVYGGTFNVMAWLMRNLPKSDLGYMLFNISSHAIAIVIMLPAAFCAGMTLPLITTALLRNGSGERSIGSVYGFNTIGSILGVFIAIHLAMPLLGLKGMIILGAGVDIALGLGLAWWTFPSWRIPAAYTTTGIIALLLTMFLVKLDPSKMASGVYQFGLLPEQTKEETLFHRDGKTATVSITKDSKNVAIKTNGKPDAGIQVTGSGHSKDEETMVMLGAIGIVLRPEARVAAIIGWGSGLTTHTLLTVPCIDSVDTIEIEPEMIKAATLFGSRVRRAYEDPRSHMRIEDAKSYFSFYNKKYDLIISEPSNPWVSGVASLFTKEFYSHVRGYLNKDGLFIQWLHLYDIDMQLVASIMKALSPYFSDYVIYASNSTDMIIAACPVGNIQGPNTSFLTMKDLMAELHKVDIMGLPDINVRMIGNKAMLSPFFESFSIEANSDYEPIVDLNAVKNRFFGSMAHDPFHNIQFDRLPLLEMLANHHANLSAANVTYSTYPKSLRIHFANMLYQYFVKDQLQWNHPEAPLRDESRMTIIHAKQVLTRECSKDIMKAEWWGAMLHIIADFVPYWSPEQLSVLLHTIEISSCAKHFSVSQRDFIALITAVGKKDAAGMAQYSQRLLEQMEQNAVDADLLEYTLSAGILGYLSVGNMQGAVFLWEKYGPLLPAIYSKSLTTRLLVTRFSSGSQRN
ncbi:MAG TPA: spermidine synthase [Nitrospirota bacterium]|nr:spermidine synthase [Nitrospirota bacterium]